MVNYINYFLIKQSGTEADLLQEIEKNPGIIRTYLEGLVPSLLSFLMQLVITVIILIIGSRVIKGFVKMIKKSLEKGKAEAGVITFLCSLIRYSLYFVLLMIVLSQFGVTTSSVVAVLGSAGLTLGLALQGSLSNFAGGVLILLMKPFVVGDYILDNATGQEGTVDEITTFYTKLLSVDNKVIVIPNGSLSNTSITNYSRMEYRRIDLTVSVAYETNLAEAKKVLQAVVENESSVVADMPCDIFVSSLADSAVELGVRVWVKNEDYWPVRWHMLEQIKLAFDENEISIPYPQLDVGLREGESQHK